MDAAKGSVVSERHSLVEALVAEVLGPRSGPTETLSSDEDPLDEYIVGVLAPASSSSAELDAFEELAGGDAPEADDGEESDPGTPGRSAVVGSLPSLNLDPMSRPSSMGISLAVRTNASPVLDICATWARYAKDAEETWQRTPFGKVWRGVDCSTDPTLTDPRDPDVLVRVRSRTDRTGGTWHISLFVVNNTELDSDRPHAHHHVYQPQIRVRCDSGEVVPVERQRPSHDLEDEGLALLYQDRPVLARGHLCSAVWRSIDPERPHPTGRRGARAPFAWADGEHLFDSATAAEFSPADARSEFVPVVSVNAPDKAWPDEVGHAPELNPSKLCEITDGPSMEQALSPLIDGYERWIELIESEAGNPDPGTPAHRHIAGCRQALERIRNGIRLLGSDVDARLAFCFANRAIALQSEWSKGKVNSWWPFQLAFLLVNLPAMADEAHPDREVCDLLWFPTGGGKTEAYLGLAAFTLAHRRLRAMRDGSTHGGAGVTVLSRYTLRLLTIQQYRRALTLVTACEYLRTTGIEGSRGWRPKLANDLGDLPWGNHRFSIGLWVGGGVTPNNLGNFQYKDSNNKMVTVYGALSILDGKTGEGDPAQVLNCPCCHSILAVPSEGFRSGDTKTLHLAVGDLTLDADGADPEHFSVDSIQASDVVLTPHADSTFSTVSITFSVSAETSSAMIDQWVNQHVLPALGKLSYLLPVRPSRPGYFIREVTWRRDQKAVDFEIYCSNPACALNIDVSWNETTEVGGWPVMDAFNDGNGRSNHCPVPAFTVDEQVYARCPSMLIATVDKFARLAYEPRASAIFGNVDHLNEHLGYFRKWAPPSAPGSSLPAQPRSAPAQGVNLAVSGFLPPTLILQDELHLIEGPLGSMVGLYETSVDLLATDYGRGTPVKPKYVASTATVRQAQEQVQSLFARSLAVFPSPGIRADESFFSRAESSHPLDSQQAGRLYVGIIAPGRGAQTPLVRTWSRLLQYPKDRRDAGIPSKELDPFWTLVGYFNAIRELAGAVALTRQDVVQRLASITPTPRQLFESDPMELSSRADSLNLPTMLDDLGVGLDGDRDAVNAVVATSMFGTGVDVDRLGLMFVNGQPKTTSSYIQATGRVGRSTGGLVVTFYRSSRPRDLSHYEYFAGYHTTLYKHVEPVTVNPFAPRARDRALGPVAVSILRQAALLPGTAGPVPVDQRWRIQQRLNNGWHCLANAMEEARSAPDVELLPVLMEQRATQQPELRRPDASETSDHAHSALDSWKELASGKNGQLLLFHEGSVTRTPAHPVVLGDLAHKVAGTGQAYENAPNSLREVESTTTIRGTH
ncbi:DISARM system helicase DrmA [Nonomuraea sp. NPDC003804]|uniref:DISARM system helicase DrmA n=1 Tax=Nonomuraea sp. NPDC003804 TaxID=3154547 RepID=UPI0033B0AD67